MSTTKPRINITMDLDSVALLKLVAEHDHISVSELSRALILEALERREDRWLSGLAEARDLDSEPRISHQKAWG